MVLYMNTTFDTLNYTRIPPENWAGLVADVQDCLGADPNPDELLQRDAVQLLWDEGRAMDPQTFEATRVFAVGRLGMEFLRHVMPEHRQAAFFEQCVTKLTPAAAETEAPLPINAADTTGLLLGDLAAKSFVEAWPSDAPKDTAVPLPVRLIANTFSIVEPSTEGHIPLEYIPLILSEEPGREAAQASIFGGALRMLQITLAKRYDAQTGERPSSDTPIKDIADEQAISAFDFFYASCQATKLHVANLSFDNLWGRTELVGDRLVLHTNIPEQRTTATMAAQQVIRNHAVGCPGMNIEGAVAFVCDASKTIVNAAQARLLNPAALPLPQYA